MEYSLKYGFLIRPVPSPGTRVKIISGPWRGYEGVYTGVKIAGPGLPGVRLHTIRTNPDTSVPVICVVDPSCMSFDELVPQVEGCW